MSMPNRGAITVPLLDTYMVLRTTSVNRRGKKTISNVLQNYAHTGIDFSIRYYGDELTWDIIALTSLTWGTSKTAPLSLNPKFTYRYDMVSSCFEILNELGSVLSRKYTSNISDFGISWEILESHNFYFYYGVKTKTSRWHLTATATKKRELLPLDELMDSLFRVDEYGYGNIDIHSLWDIRLLSCFYVKFVLSNKISQYILETPNNPTIVRSVYHWKKDIVKGDYSSFFTENNLDIKKSTPTKTRNAIIYRYYEMLMSTVFFTIYNRDNPVYEPWMLWEMWKWISAGIPSVDEERIFDISPNWSY